MTIKKIAMSLEELFKRVYAQDKDESLSDRMRRDQRSVTRMNEWNRRYETPESESEE